MSYYDDMVKAGRQHEIGRSAPQHGGGSPDNGHASGHGVASSFANAPISIGEARAERSGHAKDLTAREMLVELLRDIDSGKIDAPDFAIVCMAQRGPDEHTAVLTAERVGGAQNPLEVYGLLWRCALRLCDDTRS